jgi:hypothetical protein
MGTTVHKLGRIYQPCVNEFTVCRGLTRAIYILCIEHLRMLSLSGKSNPGPPALQASTLWKEPFELPYLVTIQDLTCVQGCEWNDKSVNRERESRTGIGSDASFFWVSLSNLVIDDNFRISYNLGLSLATNISTALPIQPDQDREIEIILWFF